ncbi:ABC transporter substrate-binding protein [Pseudonocardia nematodicida]|uniref:ABC transporter substrate-binding protein n=1 Tax=Pseudonocardia nematodicida TaxID=1206997 RepID=A0ABV1K4I4_9PSEU
MGTRAPRTWIAVIALTTLLTGCGSAVEQQTAPGEIGGSVDYGYWGNPSRAERVAAVVEGFRSVHPGTRVSSQVGAYQSYIERLTVRAAGRDLPCVTSMQSTFFAPYATQGALLPLDDLIADGSIDVSDIPEDVLESGMAEGRQFMIPTGSYVRPVAYNADLLASTGVGPPPPGWDWAGYEQWLRAIDARLPEGVYATEIEGSNLMSLFSFVASHDQEFFDDDGLGFPPELLREWFAMWEGLTRDGVSVPASMIPDQTNNMESTPMARGVAVAGTKDIPHLTIHERVLQSSGLGDEVAWATNPVAVPGASGNVIGSNGLAISADCDNVATSAAFIDYFANDPAAISAYQSDNGVVPGSRSQQVLLDDADTPEGVQRSVRVLRELSEDSDIASMTYPQGIQILTGELRRLFEDIAFGRTDIDTAVESFYAEARQALS